jgi:hypothetical protein
MHSMKKIAAIITITVCIGIGLLYWMMMAPFIQSESLLKNEMDRLQIPSGFTLVSSEFVPGECLDNCPTLTNTYQVSGTRKEVESKGYFVEYRAGRVATKTKDHLTIGAVTKPDVKGFTGDYESNVSQQNQEVTSVLIVIDYRK